MSYEMTAEEAAVFSSCQEAAEASEVIGHDSARTIASWYQDDDALATVEFCSTGAITDENLWSLLTEDGQLYTQGNAEHQMALDMFAAYLRLRINAGDYGPVPGWSEMWASVP